MKTSLTHRTHAVALVAAIAGLGSALGSSVVACGGDAPPPATPQTTSQPAADAVDASVTPVATPAVVDAGAVAQPDPPPPKPTAAVMWKGVGLATPESVLYDAVDDQYIVTNINGAPLATDNNGFISLLSPDGTVKNLKFIEGGKNKVTLNAPKGTAVVGDLLYVADINTVRIFDRKTGAPKGEVKIPGSTFLNDVAADAKGVVYVTDSGLKAGKEGFDPTGTDAVYSIDAKKKVTTLAKTKDLNRPNGIAIGPDGKVWVNTFGAPELFWLGPKGEKKDVTTLPKGSLDGLVILPGGDVLVSSWESQTVYRGKPGGAFTAWVEGVKAPADVGFDSKRSRALIPLFMSDEIQGWDVK